MPVFIFLVFLAAIVLWFLLSFAFIPVGKLIGRILGDAKDAMQQEDPEPEDTADSTNQTNESR